MMVGSCLTVLLAVIACIIKVIWAHSRHFCIVCAGNISIEKETDTIGSSVLCRTETAEFSKDDLYVARYDPIQTLLEEGWVHLI